MTFRRAFAVVLTAGLLAFGITACAPAAPITLTIGTNDTEDTNVAASILHFAELVDRASGGSITIEPEWRAGGDDAPHWDQNVAQRVIDGDLSMGMVPSRAWDALGVTSLRALNAPFVITSDQALVGATASSVQDPMLSGLSEIDVVGLDLFPESLRHPNGLSSPLVGLADYSGAVIRSPYSETSTALFEALGATTVDSAPDPDIQTAMETSYVRAFGPTVTSNVVYFGKYDVLAVSGAVWEALTDDQKRILEQASEATRSWVIENLPTDRELAAEFCERGGSLVVATEDQIAELHDAAEPVIATLREDSVTSDAIDALLALAPASSEAPTSCDGSEPNAAVELEGTYETTTTEEQLVAGGVTDPAQRYEEAATFRWQFEGTSWQYNAVADHELSQPSRNGTMSIDGARLTIFWSGQPQDNTSMDVAVLPDGSLQFTNIVDADPLFQKSSEVKFGDHPWTRIEG